MANHAGRHFAKVYEAFSKPAVGQGGTTWLELLISGGPCPVKITLFHWNSVSIHTLWLPQLTSVSYFSTWPDPHAQRLVSITTQRWVPEWVGGLYTCFSHRCLFPAAKYSLSSHTPPGAYDVDTGRYTLNSGGGSGPNAVWSEPVFPVWRGETLLHGLPYGCQLTEARRKCK